jgi:hypothetical protein
MSNLAQNILRNLKTERDMASSKGNLFRKECLNIKIEKLHRQIEEADRNDRDLSVKRDMGISE